MHNSNLDICPCYLGQASRHEKIIGRAIPDRDMVCMCYVCTYQPKLSDVHPGQTGGGGGGR